MSASEPPPLRLADSPGAAGEVLRRALADQDPAARLPRFSQLQEKRVGRSRRQWAVFSAAAALALLLGWRASRPSDAPISLRAEPVTPSAVRSLAEPAPVANPAPIAPLEPSSPAPVRRDAPLKQRAAAPALSSSPARRAPEVDSPATEPTLAAAVVEPGGGAKACAELARGGTVERAIDCYERLSRGNGVTAELALFEQARLAGKALRQPARALALLEQYRQRFPSGSLRGEAMLARIEWALALGDKSRARAQVEEALKSGLLRERSAELERLRASLEADAPAQ